jgi:beta-lactamase superfamily II metal-dependent hydrolase
MSVLRYLDTDIVSVFDAPKGTRPRTRIATLLWGDQVRVKSTTATDIVLDFTRRTWDDTQKTYIWQKLDAFIAVDTKFRATPLLKVRFVDVGQGDAAIVESPKGQMVLIDGGEERHLRNYMSASWSHILRTKPLRIDAIVVTHGDADHFAGLPNLVDLKRPGGEPAIVVERIFHNGLVKAGGSSDAKTIFGKTKVVDGETYVTELENDLLAVPAARLNEPFQKWQAAIGELKKRFRTLKTRRIGYGDDSAFSFLAPEGIAVEVLGPQVETVSGAPALRLLHTPGSRSLSASHTINGHSIVLRLTFGNVRFLFGADLNAESESNLLTRLRADGRSIASEILKVPHHGSADVAPQMLEAVRAVVSVISSGDENATKEYIHPRASLVGALGKFSRSTVDKPLVYVTEMVAFFRRLGAVRMSKYTTTGAVSEKSEHIQNAYEKTVFGIVHVRTDGERVLVATHSGREDRKEAYAFHVSPAGDITFEDSVDAD